MLKSFNIMKNLQQLTGKTATQHQNGSIKFTHNSINPKCKWTKCTNQKTQTGKLDKSQDPLVCCIQKTHLACKETHMLKIKEQRKIYQTNGEKKKAGVAILVSDKTDFKPTKIKRDKAGHYIIAKGSMQQEELTTINRNVPNTGAPRYTKQVLNDLRRDLDSYTMIVGDFNSPLSMLDRPMRQKINKDIQSGPSRPNRHLQNCPPQNHRIYILLSTTSYFF